MHRPSRRSHAARLSRRALPLLLALSAALLSTWRPSLTPKKVRTSGAMKALDAWSRARAWPDPVIPDRGHYDGALAARAMPAARVGPGVGPALAPADGRLHGGGSSAPVSHANGLPWRSLGPTNIGGRTLFVTINPQNPSTIYAGSASGGLWRSRTGGVGVDAWDRVPTGHPVLGASCLAIAPNDTSVMYLGTGEVYAWQNAQGGILYRGTRGSYGMGILKTTDAGASWELVLDWSRNQKRGIWVLRVDPEEPNRVWAGTTEGVYKSVDHGQSWTPVLNVVMAMDLEIDPQNPDTVYAACGNLGSPGYGIYRSFNGGQNWTKLGGGLPTVYNGKAQLTVSPQFPNVLYAGIAAGGTSGAGTYLLRSYDWGTNWVLTAGAVDYASYQGWYSHDVMVDPTTPERVYACGIDLWRSNSAGTNLVRLSDWQLAYDGVVPAGGPDGPPTYVHADIHALTPHPVTAGVFYMATDGGVFRTLNGGTTFESLNGGYVTGQFYPGLAVAPADTVPAMGGLQDNFSAIYQGGPAWNRVIGGDGCWAAIDPTNVSRLYGSYQGLNILRSEDAGMTWSDKSPPILGSTTAFVAPYVLSPANPSLLYAGRSIVFRSTNRGDLWYGGGYICGRPILSMAAAPDSAGRLIVGTEPDAGGNAVYRSDDAGVSWTNIGASLPNRYPLDVVIAPDDFNTFYVTLGGYDCSHVWKSVDSGATWQDIGSSLPDLPTWALAVDPLYPDHLYVGNDLGVFVSPDGGATWGSFNEGLPEAVIVSDLVVTPGPRRLRVATHGNGVFERGLPAQLTAVGPDPAVPAPRLPALAASPNPFRSQVRLSMAARGGPEGSTAMREASGVPVRLTVHDVSGRLLRTLELPAGAVTVDWDGNDDAGRPVATGTYFVRMESATSRTSLRLVRIR